MQQTGRPYSTAGQTAIVLGPSASKRAPYPTPSPPRRPLTATTRLPSVMTGVSGSVAASGGGTIPYKSRPGRTRSHHTRESRSSAALLAA